MKTLKICLISVLLAACKEPAEKLPVYNSPDFTPVWGNSMAAQHYIADFEFIDQNEEGYGTNELEGKIHVMNCFFTACPSLCPTLMGNLMEVQNSFKGDPEVQMISLSVTPERDSISRLISYAELNGIRSSNWHLLTGDKKLIYQTARQSYFVDENIGTELNENDFLHTENVILVDQNLQIRGIYNGSLPLEIEQLIEDIKTLKKEL
ncbi:SCO family protein [Jiulongibacter sediminis]|uniref:SCO family protein n=1 Tax=Jiulongibacter sediminis TaxID=1605367 RepID=UPI0026F1AFFB|nr:SCO family protein [Jiulongibacter sediminis]